MNEIIFLENMGDLLDGENYTQFKEESDSSEEGEILDILGKAPQSEVVFEEEEEEDSEGVVFEEDHNHENELESFLSGFEEMTIPELKKEVIDDIESVQDDMEEVVEKYDDAKESLSDEFDDLIEDVGKKVKVKDILPGSDVHVDSKDEDEKDDSEKTYEQDRWLPDFFRHVVSLYPSQIPQHDGQTTLGCEKAISWLQRLSNEISTNVRNDVDGVLEIDKLAEIQDSILSDILILKDHIKKLKQKLPEKIKQSSTENIMTKVAATPNNIVISVTPFIRAITGILINSTVSAGKPFEEVYDYLVEKYEISEREQLEILQVLMDMGQPIFKDRGTMPGQKENKKTEESEDELQGIDFITNYFA